MTASVLVVDDLEPNVRLLEAKLLSEYYIVHTATNGVEALEVLKKQKIDIVLLDIMMPEMDGFETCQHIKSNPETMHIPVVMVTALSDIEDRIKGLEAGADEFLTKPINDTALFARVKSLTRMKSIIDELKLRNNTSAELGANVADFIDNFKKSKILLIDDDVIQAKNIKAHLKTLSDNVQVINSSTNVDKITDAQDLVIISLQLDEEDPLRLVATLKNKPKFNQAIFMLLAEDENIRLVIKGMEIGVNDYFVYPVDRSELHARVKTQLRRKQYQDNLRDELEESVDLSTKDGLTGVFNRRYFDIHLNQMIEKANSNKSNFCLLLMDIDHFKEVNDIYGHTSGDEVLKALTQEIKRNLRVTDLVARYGGEEFAIVLRDTKIDDGYFYAENIRQKIANRYLDIPGSDEPIFKTLSIGLAEYKHGESKQEFIDRADKALYEAKEKGRNQTISSN